jgi:hypothetical protein
VGAALQLLVDYDWLSAKPTGPGTAGGRPGTLFTVNPKVAKAP